MLKNSSLLIYGRPAAQNQNDGSIIFEVEVAVTDEIRSWIMGWGAKAEVLEPEFLKAEIQSEVEEMQERYKKGLGREEKPITA